MIKIRVWDLPLRLFHWSLAVLVVAAIVTQKIGGNAMAWHFRCGYAALALVLFRLLWGMVGSRYARFWNFIYSPKAIWAYIKNGSAVIKEKYAGHNPLGSLSVFGLLGIILLQTVSGLFSNDDIANEGPLVKFISKEWSDQISAFHKDGSGTLIYVLIGLHIAAIFYYSFMKKEDLVTAMITGDKELDFSAEPAKDFIGMRFLAFVLFSICAGGVYYLVNL